MSARFPLSAPKWRKPRYRQFEAGAHDPRHRALFFTQEHSVFADHARRRLKLIRIAIAHAHARSHATSAMSRLEPKKKNPAAKVQQRNVRSFQPAPPGPVVSIARVNGARRTAKDPKTRRLSLSRLLTGVPLSTQLQTLTWPSRAPPARNCNRRFALLGLPAPTPAASQCLPQSAAPAASGRRYPVRSNRGRVRR